MSRIKKYIKRFFNWIKGALDNAPSGASSKKMAGFWALNFLVTPIVITWAIWAYKHDDWEYLRHIIDACLLYSAVALGINSYDKRQFLNKFKDKDDEGTAR